jgi:membrane dipeptidase
LTGARNYSERLETQFNLPNMIDGGLDALFFIIYVGQTREAQNPDALKPVAYERAYKSRQRQIHSRASIHRRDCRRTKLSWHWTRADVRRINAQGKKAALMGVENGYPIGEDIARVGEFYDRGARYLSLTHNGHNQLADSHTGERDGWKWQGVSPLGKRVIARVEPPGHHGRRLARIQSSDDADRRAFSSADHRLALRHARRMRYQPQHGRRTIARL